MPYAEILERQRQEMSDQKEKILAGFAHRLNPAEFVIARRTLSQIVNKELTDFELFLNEIRDDNHDLVTDLRSKDKLAWILRVTLHIEGQIKRLVADEGLRAQNNQLFHLIEALKQSRTPVRTLVPVLHVLRSFRNAPAHELDAGRVVTQLEARSLYDASPISLRREMLLMSQEHPLSLEPQWLAKLCCLMLHNELESVLRVTSWARELHRVLPQTRPARLNSAP